jgi:hypothetical protein
MARAPITRIVDEILERIPSALEAEARALARFHGNWWLDGTRRVKGLASRREAHLVFTIGAALKAADYTVILDDGFEGSWESKNYRKRCDLAVLLPTPAERWLWLEAKAMPVEDMRDKLDAARLDVEKLDEVGSVAWNLPQALLLVVFAYGDDGAARCANQLSSWGAANGLSRWRHRPPVVFPLDGGEGAYDRCVVATWSRVKPLTASARTSPSRAAR